MWDFDGVSVGVEVVGGTTTQFFASSSVLLLTCLRFEGRGGVCSGVGWSM
jgi:hypothetical protein